MVLERDDELRKSVSERHYSRFVRIVAGASLVLVALLPFAGAIAGWSGSDENLVVRTGMAVALLAIGQMVLQIVIGSRLRLVSDPIGLGQLLQALAPRRFGRSLRFTSVSSSRW